MNAPETVAVGSEKRTAYMLLETERTAAGEYIPCIAVEGERGYHRTDWTWGKDLKIAQECADKKNAMLGLSKEDALKIVFSTMR